MVKSGETADHTGSRNDSNVSTASTTAHSLPFEIIVEVLRFASLLSTRTALSVCLVATWTKTLGREGLYGVVVISSISRLEMFFKTLGYPSTESSSLLCNQFMDRLGFYFAGRFRCCFSTPSDLGRRQDEHDHPRPELLQMVRNLWLPIHFFDNLPVADVLATCMNISSLSTPSVGLKYIVEATSGLTQLRYLMLTTPAFRYDWREANLRKRRSLCELTHLFITTAEEDSCFIPMADLPSLTHLAVPLITSRGSKTKQFDEFAVATHLLQYEQLQMVIVHYREADVRKTLPRRVAEGLVANANALDMRLYAMPFSSVSEIRGLWKSGARGQDSVWKDAKVVLRHAQHAQHALFRR